MPNEYYDLVVIVEFVVAIVVAIGDDDYYGYSDFPF